MKQNPSRLKFKKYHRPAKSMLYLKEQKSFFPLKGQLALRSIENGRLTYNQIEACRKSIRRMLAKQGSIIIRVFTNFSMTKKPLASRMGKGKGSHHIWICRIKKGQVICEVIVNYIAKFNISYKALEVAGKKLSVKTNICINFY